jgi:hypothetical protein
VLVAHLGRAARERGGGLARPGRRGQGQCGDERDGEEDADERDGEEDADERDGEEDADERDGEEDLDERDGDEDVDGGRWADDGGRS